MDNHSLERVKQIHGIESTFAVPDPQEMAMKRLNRRRFLQGAAALTPLFGVNFGEWMARAQGIEPTSHPGTTLFVGTQTVDGSKGIYAYHWNASEGSLRLIGLAIVSAMPTFLVLSPNKQFVFAANETETFHGAKSGGVSSFRVNHSAAGPARLSAINSQIADGPGTTNVDIDHTGRVLLCANYTGGSASSFAVDESGHISPVVSHFQFTGHGPNQERQEAPHVHRATASPGNRFALFNDLGLDVIHIYAMDAKTAKLTPHEPSAWHAPAGSGPRALRFHPNGRWAYCITEMGSEVIVLDWDESKGTLTTSQHVPLIPPDFHGRSQASEISIDHTGRFAYVADRYYDMMFSYVIDPASGKLTEKLQTPAKGKTARYITLDPTQHWLLAADQDSNTIEIFKRDPMNGRLSSESTLVPQVKPQCLVFV
jgi:6-phosphogluconolactonase